MNILIINTGSSSIKFQLMHMPSESVLCSGMVDRIGLENGNLKYTKVDYETNEIQQFSSHRKGLNRVIELLLDPANGAITDVNEIDAVGHRVVHGGTAFSETTIITQEVKDKIGDLSQLAPLHNPHNLEGILIAEELFPNAKQVAVFDTAFHQTIPLKARKYAIPDELYTKHGIQLYGFHGTSHKYVTEKAISFLDKKVAKIISIHLGNGCSITAVYNGKSMDHSLGFAPSNGLIMGSRSGDIDHSMIFYLVESLGYSLREVNDLLNKKSGMLGLTGYSDLREIQAKANEGDAKCRLALEMNAYRIKKYIGAYSSVLNGLDVLIFTAGIGENSSYLRELVCSEMDFLGIDLDMQKNAQKSHGIREIQNDSSRVKILVIPTNEELEIAKQTFDLLKTS
ncbi:acetate/propionate family kinase [uncultured Eudoraea sp.]|jgi:acetate kinase|uniref:acetate/propionate family kinase n=1 Tax=uncultured Eudoraea sp. TaxID=1035614 RepID=UPI002613BADB|nr:acetate kinase [uncultured Eudoraea sp.]